MCSLPIKNTTEHLVRLRSTLEPTTPDSTSQRELTSTFEDLAAVARDVLRLSDDLSLLSLSRYGEPDARNPLPDLAPPNPTTSIVSDTFTSRKVFEPLTQTVRTVGVPPSPITPPSPIHTAIAGLGTDPTQPQGLVPRKRLPSSAGASCDDTELERDVLARRRKQEASFGKEDHTPSRAISSGHSPTDLRQLIYNIKTRDKLSRIPSFPDTDPPSTIMLRRVVVAQGGQAIRQFYSLIHTRRSRETEMGLLKVDSTGIERALELIKRFES